MRAERDPKSYTWPMWKEYVTKLVAMTFRRVRVISAAIAFLYVAPALADPYQGAVFDAHAHMGGSFDPVTLNRVMDENGVTRQLLMARYYEGPAGDKDLPGSDALSLELAAAYPGRFFPLVGMQRPELTGSDKWRDPPAGIETLLRETEQKLASGKFYGIGELIVRHFAYTKGRHAELDHPIYSAFTRRLSAIAMRFDVPIVIHMEGDPRLVDDFGQLLGEYGMVRYVWAHNCGRSRAVVIRSMLERHANLVCDLASMTNLPKMNYGNGSPRMEPFTALMEEGGTFYPDMKQIYEDFPDRFTIGMDVAHAPGMNSRNYSRRANRFRRLLGQLSPETARLIAEGNALRIFKLGNR